MSRPDDFERNTNPTDGQNERGRQGEQQTDTSDEPKWYRVSYQNDEGIPPIATPIFDDGEEVAAARKRGKKALLIAVLVAAAVLLLSFAAFGGAMLANWASSIGDSTPTPNQTITGGGSSTTQGSYYAENGGSSYDYAAVVLEKNDGSALVSSQNGSAGDAVGTKISVAAAVKDSVVEITTTVISNRGTISAGAGSGVIIHADGIIVTNNHVVADCDEIYVRLTNGHTYKAYLRGVDEMGDIAILKIAPQETLTVAKLGNSAALAVGEEVIAIGNPLGELGGTVTNGIVSALSREINVDGNRMTLLQTNAAINSGNSGGGLFNMAGELIGIVNAKYSATGVEGLGFAIPIDTAYVSIMHLLEHGYIPGIPWLGITVELTTIGNWFDGYYSVLYVYDPGTNESFAQGDYVYSVDGTVVKTVEAFYEIILSHSVGDTVSVVIVRNGTQKTVSVTLEEYIPS